MSACNSVTLGGASSGGLQSAHTTSQAIEKFSPGSLGANILENLPKSVGYEALKNELLVLEKGPAGAAQNWSFSGEYAGVIVPAQPFKIGGRICRQYSHEISGPDIAEARKATACRDAEKNWQLVR